MSVQHFTPTKTAPKQTKDVWSITLQPPPSKDSNAKIKRFGSVLGEHLLWVDGSRIFDLDDENARWLDKVLHQEQTYHQTDPALAKFLDETEQTLGVAIGDKPAQAQEVRAISL
ncbi:MAG: hypothetical protein HRT35_12850, partial [Algicola sp.]|nr:hypothetical protein [Algicola sp.]